MAMVISFTVTAVVMRMLRSAMDSEIGKRQCECACDTVGAYVAHFHVVVTKAVSDFSLTYASLCRYCTVILCLYSGCRLSVSRQICFVCSLTSAAVSLV